MVMMREVVARLMKLVDVFALMDLTAEERVTQMKMSLLTRIGSQL